MNYHKFLQHFLLEMFTAFLQVTKKCREDEKEKGKYESNNKSEIAVAKVTFLMLQLERY